mmetsp:Transcript_44913/g.141415  ORF Transcript_44913/g.141415 Transcript_44913/m.141415 type:complete len:237 (-) Transcript_44913:82-792(-)
MAGKGGRSSAWTARMAKEMKQLEIEPPPGISAWPRGEQIHLLEAVVQGPAGTPYEGGAFKLEISVPDRYPFEPPKVRFMTPIYHPNIDSGGRICLDILNMPPKGQWKPALNLSTVLTSIQLLISEPNPDDGLMPEITQEYKQNRLRFEAKARESTKKHAVDRGNVTLSKSWDSHEEAKENRGVEIKAGNEEQKQQQGEDEEEESDDNEEEIAQMWGATKPTKDPTAQKPSSSGKHK